MSRRDPIPPVSNPHWILKRLLVNADGLLVLDKPSDLPSTGATLQDPDCAQSLLWAALRRKVWAVHQLDRGTTGVNVFVTRKSLVPVWQERLTYPSAQKRYIAWVHGHYVGETLVDTEIGWDPALKRWSAERPGKRAVSEVHSLAVGRDSTLVEVKIRTGRTHQVRVHMAHLGHPLVGEGRYRLPACKRMQRVALHAAELHVREAMDFEGQRFCANTPRDMIAYGESQGVDVGAAM